MKWYEIVAKAGETKATIHVYDEIGGWGISGKRFADEVRNLSADTIELYINSPGGSVFDALLMFNALQASGKTINVKIVGIAASAASYLAMAGSHISMPRNTFQFVHNALGALYGDADDMREFAEVLDKITSSLKATYAKRTGLEDAKLTELFNAKSYLTADECLALGLADEVTDEIEATARFDTDRPDLPANIKAVFEAAKNRTPPAAPPVAPPAPAATFAAQVKALVDAAGLGDHLSVFATDPALATIEAVQAAIADAREISELCSVLGRAEDASGLIKDRKSLPQAREALATVLAANADSRHTSNVQRSAPTEPEARTGASSTSIWSQVRKNEAQARKPNN